MLIDFSVQNFGSIKEKQTLSFEADKSTHLEDYYIIKSVGGLRLLKLGLIYGANASGKTTVLKALDFLRNIVVKPVDTKTEQFKFNPFLFDAQTPEQNTVFTINFIQNDVHYYYEVELNRHAIVREELYYYPNKVNVFKRVTDLDKQYTTIIFGQKIKVSKAATEALEANTLWNNTVLGGFLKINMESAALKDVTHWFKGCLSPITTTDLEINRIIMYAVQKQIHKGLNKEIIIKSLKNADFNISNFYFQEKDDLTEFTGKRLKKENEVINEDPELSSEDLDFEHTINDKKYELSFNDESQGTQRYYGLAGLLSLLIRNPVVISIDELESSLHPDLFTHFLLSFLVNSKKSQLIATTHNREILSNKDIFRNDAIWITNKDDNGGTELYSLADFDTSVIRDTSNILNAYKIGKLGGVPNLGDYYIDIEDESE